MGVLRVCLAERSNCNAQTLAVHVRTLAANHRSNTLVYLLQQTGQQQPCFQSIRIDRSIFQSCIRRRVFFTNCESTSESRCLFCCREHKTTNLRMLQRAVCTSQNEISRNIWKPVAPSPKPVDVAAHNTPSEQRNEAVLRCFCNRACTHQRSSSKSWCCRERASPFKVYKWDLEGVPCVSPSWAVASFDGHVVTRVVMRVRMISSP